MFTLLNDLRKLRRSIPHPRPRRGSCAIRLVDAGSCNGCEHEFAALANPYYDLSQYGLSITASPRHADVLLVTGPITTRMQEPLLKAYAAMPEPRLVAALGDCPLGRGVFAQSADVIGDLEQVLPVDIRIPGCPPAPDRIAEALLTALDLRTPRHTRLPESAT